MKVGLIFPVVLAVFFLAFADAPRAYADPCGRYNNQGACETYFQQSNLTCQSFTNASQQQECYNAADGCLGDPNALALSNCVQNGIDAGLGIQRIPVYNTVSGSSQCPSGSTVCKNDIQTASDCLSGASTAAQAASCQQQLQDKLKNGAIQAEQAGNCTYGSSGTLLITPTITCPTNNGGTQTIGGSGSAAMTNTISNNSSPSAQPLAACPTTNPNCNINYTPLEPLTPQEGTNFGDFPTFLRYLFPILVTLGALIAVVRLVAAGFLYMTSDIADKKSTAKESIRSSLIGLLILIGSVLILQTINPKLTNFDLQTPICTAEGGTLNADGSCNVPQATQSSPQPSAPPGSGNNGCSAITTSGSVDIPCGTMAPGSTIDYSGNIIPPKKQGSDRTNK